VCSRAVSRDALFTYVCTRFVRVIQHISDVTRVTTKHNEWHDDSAQRTTRRIWLEDTQQTPRRGASRTTNGTTNERHDVAQAAQQTARRTNGATNERRDERTARRHTKTSRNDTHSTPRWHAKTRHNNAATARKDQAQQTPQRHANTRRNKQRKEAIDAASARN